MIDRKKSSGKFLWFLVVTCSSLFIGYHLQPVLESKPRLVGTFVTIFSILAGFLIAIMIFVIEPVIKKSKSWEELQNMEKVVSIRLKKCKLLFYLYLLSLCLAVAVDLFPSEHESIHKLIQIAFLSLSIGVLITSFGLPKKLVSIQMKMYNEALQESEPEGIGEARREVEDRLKKVNNEDVPKE